MKEVKYQLVIVQFVTEKKSMTLSDNTIQGDELGSFFSKTWERFLLKLLKNRQPMHSQIQVNFLKSVLTLLPQPEAEILKMYYQHYVK